MRPFHRIEAQQVRARSDVERAREDGLVVETSDPTVSQALSWAIARLGTLLSVHTAARTPRLSPSAALLAGLGAAVTGEFDALANLSAAGPVVLRDLARAWDGRDEVGSNKDAPDSLAMILSRFEAREGGLVQLRRPGAIDQALAPYENWLEGWHRFDAGDAEEGTRVLDGLLAVGIRNGLAWGLSERGAEDVGLTALIPTTLVYGVLRARPDAGVGRLKLAPQLPAAWGAVTVRNLRMADSRVSMAYRQTGSRHVFTLEQTRGAVPINLVFEPTVPGKAVRDAHLDGKRVELDEIASHNRVGVRLQLPLDGPREIAILVGQGRS
jgi:hypothetical protein